MIWVELSHLSLVSSLILVLKMTQTGEVSVYRECSPHERLEHMHPRDLPQYLTPFPAPVCSVSEQDEQDVKMTWKLNITTEGDSEKIRDVIIKDKRERKLRHFLSKLVVWWNYIIRKRDILHTQRPCCIIWRLVDPCWQNLCIEREMKELESNNFK